MANEQISATIEIAIPVKPGERSERKVAKRVGELERDLRARLKGMDEEMEINVRAVDVVQPTTSET